MTDEMEIIWNKMVMASSRGDGKENTKILTRIDGVPVDIQSEHLNIMFSLYLIS
jgi:hypothetical protein